MSPHPCLRCGACCAHFRVSFHWSEADVALGGVVPIALTDPLRQHERVMHGTSQAKPRCVALDAEIGVYSRCTIHPQRPSPCRAVRASWEPMPDTPAMPSDQCDRSRIAHGLAPLTPADWATAAADAGAEAEALEVTEQALPGHRQSFAQLLGDDSSTTIVFLQASDEPSGLAAGDGPFTVDVRPEDTWSDDAAVSGPAPTEGSAPA